MEAGSSIDSREVHSLKVEPSVIAMPSGSVISVSADAPETCPSLRVLQAAGQMDGCQALAAGYDRSRSNLLHAFIEGQSLQLLHVLQSRIENFDTARNDDLCYIFEAG